MPKGVYQRKPKTTKAIPPVRVKHIQGGKLALVSGHARVAALSAVGNTCRVVMSLQVPAGGAEIKLTNTQGRVIGTLKLTDQGLIMVRPNQKKAPERILSYIALSRLMEVGVL